MSAGFRAGAVLLAVFALGVVSGMAYERHAGHPRAVMTMSEEHQASMAELRELLDLDEEQVAQIDAVLARHQGTVEHMWEQLRPEVQVAMQNVHEEITALLRPEQRKRFHEWLMANLNRHEGPRHH